MFPTGLLLFIRGIKPVYTAIVIIMLKSNENA